jgi:hypothetical protein
VGLFGRRVRGRHALGAAVTSIPSGPVPVALVPPAASPPVAAVLSGAVPEPAPAPSAPQVIDQIEALLPSDAVWPVPVPVPDVLPVGAAVAVAQTEPSWSPPVLGRVQLGFRDGSSAALDPSSSHSQALEELAQSLTRRR